MFDVVDVQDQAVFREIVVRGKRTRIKRKDVQTQIDEIVSREDVDNDTAWELVIVSLQAHMNCEELEQGWIQKWLDARKHQVNEPVGQVETPLIASGKAQGAVLVPVIAGREQTVEVVVVEDQQKQNEVTFPTVPTTQRFLPRSMLRTSIFHAGSNNSLRKTYKNAELLAVIGDGHFTMAYTGPELRRQHETVFMEILKLYRGKRPGAMVTFNIYQFAAQVYKDRAANVGQKDVAVIDKICDDMLEGRFIFTNPKMKVEVNARLLDKYDKDDAVRWLRLDPAASPIYYTYTTFDYDLSSSLSDLAWQVGKYLMSLPPTVTDVYPIRDNTFFEHCYGTVASQIQHQMDEKGVTADAAKRALTKKLSHFRTKSLPALLAELKARKVIVDFHRPEGLGRTTIKLAGEGEVKREETGGQQDLQL